MTQLVQYDEARRALQICSTIDEAKEIGDKAAALAAYARQRNDVEMERWVAEIKLRAVVRIGELSRDLDASKGGANPLATLPSGGKSKAETLRSAGISTSQAHRAEQLAEHVGEVEAYIARKAEQRKPVKFTEAMAAVESQAREERQRERLHREVPVYASGLHLGDFREKSAMLADECAELVFTDPPYDRDSIPLFADAAREAARILKPGGSFIAYCGQIQLPDVLRLCGEHLRYWWVIANIHADRPNQMDKYGIKNHWKPLVWFVKGTRGDVQTFVPDTVTGAREKSHHAWQQAESEAAFYIEKLTSPFGLVVDFFAGGGTTLVAAERLGRPWLAFEIDPASAERASKRVEALRAEAA